MATSSPSAGRLATVACAALVVGLLPTHVASAAPPVTETSTRVSIPECPLPEVDGVTGALSVFWVEDGRPDSSLTLFEDGSQIAAEDSDQTTTEWDGEVLSGSFTLVDSLPETEDPVGTAEFETTLAPVGAATSHTERSRLGNATVRETVTHQPFEVAAGTVTVVLGTRTLVFDATGCSGTQTTTVTVTSQPDAYVVREDPGFLALCEATGADGDVLLLDLDSHGAPHVAIEIVSGDRVLFGSGMVDWSRPPQPVTATFEVLEAVGEELVVVGTATVDLTTVKTGQTTSTLVYQGGRDRLATTFYTVAGTVTVTGSGTFSISGCEGYVSTALDRTSSPAGPPAGGPAPVNDLRAGTVELVRGASGTNTRTGGAAPAPEAPFGCTADYPGELQPGRTVWFRFTGTGGEVTLDPSGSSFNTVLAVYTEQEGDRVEIGCVDDAGFGTPDPTLQGPLTVATEQGVTYHVQVGGIGGQYGRLRLAAAG